MALFIVYSKHFHLFKSNQNILYSKFLDQKSRIVLKIENFFQEFVSRSEPNLQHESSQTVVRHLFNFDGKNKSNKTCMTSFEIVVMEMKAMGHCDVFVEWIWDLLVHKNESRSKHSSENLFLTRLLIGLCQVAEKGTQEVNNFRNLCFLSLLKQVGDTGSRNCGYCCTAHVKIRIMLKKYAFIGIHCYFETFDWFSYGVYEQIAWTLCIAMHSCLKFDLN